MTGRSQGFHWDVNKSGGAGWEKNLGTDGSLNIHIKADDIFTVTGNMVYSPLIGTSGNLIALPSGSGKGPDTYIVDLSQFNAASIYLVVITAKGIVTHTADVQYSNDGSISFLHPDNAIGSVEVTAGSSGNVTGITVNSVEVMNASVAWTTSDTATAALIATSINAKTSIPNYTATSNGAVVSIRAVTSGTNPDAFVVTASVSGDVTTTDVNVVADADALWAATARNVEALVPKKDMFAHITLEQVTGVAENTWAYLIGREVA